MPARSRKSLATSTQHAAKKSKQVHGEPSPDEAPALATKRLPVVHTVDEYSAAERIEMDAMYERHELLFPDDGSEL